MELSKKAAGMFLAELISADLEQTVAQLNRSGIELFQLQMKDPLTVSFWVCKKDWKHLKLLAQRNDCRLTLCAQTGLDVFWRRVLHRPILAIFCVAALLVCLYLPNRILFVQVEGNRLVPTRQILAAAEQCGVRFGASRRDIRSEKIKNALLSTISQLQWAGVNTRGCVAVISVQERSGEMTAENPQGICSLISIRDGYILSATATKGNLLVQPGNTVQKGQVLISGYTDCGLSIRAEYAQGEVHAQTSRVLQAVMPRKWLLHVPEGAEKKKYSLLIGKKRINLWKDSGISPSTCGRMYKEYYITLPGGFQLPAAICIDTYTERSVEPVILQQEDAADSLYGFASDYLIQQMIAGQILHREVHLTEAEDCFYFLGTYICQEMIARVRLEQIGDIHGENHRTDR